MADEFRGLAHRYPTALRRQGSAYPTVVEPWRPGPLEPPAVVELTARLPGEPQVRDDEHLRSRLAADPGLHDGPTLCWLSGGADDEVLRAEPGGYFDMLATCAALRAEVARSGDWADPAANPLRTAVHELAGDPVRSGRGRSAAIGVSVVLTVPHGRPGERAMVIGRRPGRHAHGGLWHVAPSGMLEWDDEGPVTTTVRRELAEELAVELPAEGLGQRLSVLGIAQDLAMLRPDLVVRLDLADDEVPDDLRPASEFAHLDLVPLTRSGLETFWAAHPPSTLVPHAAGAVALAERSVR